MAQHGYEYCNTVGWFYDTFEHPHRLKLQPVAALFINRGSEHQPTRRATAAGPSPPDGIEAWSSRQILEKLEPALLALRADESVDLTAAYLKGGYDRAPLVQTLATAACKVGNDPHNQELGLCTLEDYLHTRAHDRDRLLLASAQHTAGHRKYGDHLEAYRRFAEALGLDGLSVRARLSSAGRLRPRPLSPRRTSGPARSRTRWPHHVARRPWSVAGG